MAATLLCISCRTTVALKGGLSRTWFSSSAFSWCHLTSSSLATRPPPLPPPSLTVDAKRPRRLAAALLGWTGGGSCGMSIDGDADVTNSVPPRSFLMVRLSCNVSRSFLKLRSRMPPRTHSSWIWVSERWKKWFKNWGYHWLNEFMTTMICC